jgi:hypothetical protein
MLSQTLVGSVSILHVGCLRTVELDLKGIGEDVLVPGSRDEGDEDQVILNKGHFLRSVLENNLVAVYTTVQSKGTGKTSSLKSVLLDNLPGIIGILSSQALDLSKVLSVLLLQVEVEDLGENLSLVGSGSSGGGDNVFPGNLSGGVARLDETVNHVVTVVAKGRLVAATDVERVPNTLEPSPRLQSLNLLLNDGTELTGGSVGGMTEREGLGRVHIEEDGNEHGAENHVKLLLSVDSLGVVLGLEGEVEYVSGEDGLCDVTNITDGIDLVAVGTGKLVSLLADELGGCLLVEILDLLLPVDVTTLSVETLSDKLLHAGEGGSITRQHELGLHDVVESGTPGNLEVGRVGEDSLGGSVRANRNTLFDALGTVKVELVNNVERGVNLPVLGGDGQGMKGIDAVVLEVVRECLEEKLVGNSSVKNVLVGGSLLNTPVGQSSRCVVDGVESVGTDKSHSIGQDGTRNSVGRSDSNTRNHRLLVVLSNDTRVELDKVRVVVELAESVGNNGVGVDALEGLVLLESKELTELVKGSNLPLTSLLDSKNLNKTHDVGNVTSSESSGGVLNGLHKDLDEIVVVEASIGLTDKVLEGALGGVLGDAHLPDVDCTEELRESDLLDIYIRSEQLLVKLLSPEVVTLGDTRVPSVDQVELDGDHVTNTCGGSVRVVHLGGIETRVESPCCVDTVKVDDGSQVVVKDEVDVETTSDTDVIVRIGAIEIFPQSENLQSGGLEKVLILLLQCLCILGLQIIIVPSAVMLEIEASTLVDLLQP